MNFYKPSRLKFKHFGVNTVSTPVNRTHELTRPAQKKLILILQIKIYSIIPNFVRVPRGKYWSQDFKYHNPSYILE